MKTDLRIRPTEGVDVEVQHRLVVEGDLPKSKSLSASGFFGDHLLLAGDEKNLLMVLEFEDGTFRLREKIQLSDEAAENDLEAIAVLGNDVYVCGSHCGNREALEDDRPIGINRDQLRAEPEFQASRRCIYRVRLDRKTAKLIHIVRKDLWLPISNDPVLHRFSAIPSKENGVDIEGLAVWERDLLAGFRGPVLRGNLVPVMRFSFDALPARTEFRYVNLGGLGVRDMTATNFGLLVLAGPVNDADGPYRLYLWDGHDMVPGARRAERMGQARVLADIDPPRDGADCGRPESISVFRSEGVNLTLLLVCDGLRDGAGVFLQLAVK